MERRSPMNAPKAAFGRRREALTVNLHPGGSSSVGLMHFIVLWPGVALDSPSSASSLAWALWRRLVGRSGSVRPTVEGSPNAEPEYRSSPQGCRWAESKVSRKQPGLAGVIQADGTYRPSGGAGGGVRAPLAPSV